MCIVLTNLLKFFKITTLSAVFRRVSASFVDFHRLLPTFAVFWVFERTPGTHVLGFGQVFLSEVPIINIIADLLQ